MKKNLSSNDFLREFALAQSLIDTHLSIRANLKELGVIRTNRDVISDYGEWIAANLLNLKLVPNDVQKGYDSTDRKGKKYEIKARRQKKRGSPAYHFRQVTPKEFDFAVFVEFNQYLFPSMIAVVPYLVFKRHVTKTKRSFRFYFTKEMRKNPNIRFVKIPLVKN